MKTFDENNLLFKRYCSVCYICLCVLAILLPYFISGFKADFFIYLLAFLVVLLGLPHGALDFELARSMKLVKSIRSAVMFNFAYILVGVVGIVCWIFLPWLGLTVFLIISAFHFSADWRDSLSFINRLCLATIILCGPTVLHAERVSELFSVLLVPYEESVVIVNCMNYLFIAGGITLFTNCVINAKQFVKTTIKKTLIGEISVLILSSIILAPLAHFVLYFCFLHSPKHLSDVATNLRFTKRKAFMYSLPIVVITLLIAYLVYVFFASQTVTVDIIRWVFIGLFGLTLAHMCLIHVWHRKAC